MTLSNLGHQVLREHKIVGTCMSDSVEDSSSDNNVTKINICLSYNKTSDQDA